MMEIRYKQANQHTTIHYGETFYQSFSKEQFRGKQLIFFTNQKWYDQFVTLISDYFVETDIDWYIFSNQLYCQTITELPTVLQFLAKFDQTKEYVFIALGNEGVVSFTSFLHKHTLLPNDWIVITYTIQSLVHSLTGEFTLIQAPITDCLKWSDVPQAIYYFDQGSGKTLATQMIDLASLILLSAVAEPPFLGQLMQTFSNQKQLQKHSFVSYIDRVVDGYEKMSTILKHDIIFFEQAFYTIANGHLLSAQMKRFLAIFFYLIWQLLQNDKRTQAAELVRWLHKLGYPVPLPRQIILADYLIQVQLMIGSQRLFLKKAAQTYSGSNQQVTTQQFNILIEFYEQQIKELKTNE